MALKYCPFSRSAGGDLWKHRVTYAVFGSRRLVDIKLWSLSRRLSPLRCVQTDNKYWRLHLETALLW
jgi:hypothetical protein